MSNSKEWRAGDVGHVVKNGDRAADVHARLMETLDHAATPAGPGGQWPDLLALLAEEFEHPVEGSRRGKAACHALVALARQNAVAVITKAEQTGVLSPIPVAQARIALLDHIQARFNQWQTEVDRITAEQEGSATEKFALDINMIGTGCGSITRSRESDGYMAGSNIVLTASADAGSIFNGWQGDASHLSAVFTAGMDSAKTITARFDKLDIPDLEIGVAYDHTEDARMVSGEEAFIMYLTFTNQSEKQAQIEIPLSVYASSNGEEIEQSVWFSGLVNGNKSCTIRAGAFRDMGLVFFKTKLTRISTGDHLQLTVIQKKPTRRLHFSFRCTHQELQSFALIDATVDEVEAPEKTIELAEILRRLALLENGLSNMHRKLDGMQMAPTVTAVKVMNRKPPENTLREVVAWLATQDRIAVATLRIHLLPLDLLPTAIIDKLNERALDLTGEIALEELGGEIVVTREILDEILANWDAYPVLNGIAS